MSVFSSKKAQIQERSRDALASMTPRDRMLLIVSAIMIVLFLLVSSGIFIKTTLATLQEEIATADQTHNKLQVYQIQLADFQTTAASFEEKIEKHKNTDLSAFLSKSSQKAGIQDKILDRVKEKSSAKAGLLTQKTYNVPLKEITLSNFVSFLYEIETAGYPFEIQQCTIRTRKRGEEQKLRVDFDIMTYQLNKPKEVEQ